MATFKEWVPKPKKKKNMMTVSEMAKLGAEAVNLKYGLVERRKWGLKGGNTTKNRYGPEYYLKVGAMGNAAIKERIRKARVSKDGMFKKLKRKKRADRATAICK